jgi:hypothetical protein
MEAGKSARPQLGEGASPALAAFVKRPQADSSNRRYRFSIEWLFLSVNMMIFPKNGYQRNFILNFSIWRFLSSLHLVP